MRAAGPSEARRGFPRLLQIVSEERDDKTRALKIWLWLCVENKENGAGSGSGRTRGHRGK